MGLRPVDHLALSLPTLYIVHLRFTVTSGNPDMSKIPSDTEKEIRENGINHIDRYSEQRTSHDILNGDDAEFGGPEERRRLERKLLRKIDMRISILVVIYMYGNLAVLPEHHS